MKKNISYTFNPFPAVAWLRKTGFFNRKNSLFSRGIGIFGICGMIVAEREAQAYSKFSDKPVGARNIRTHGQIGGSHRSLPCVCFFIPAVAWPHNFFLSTGILTF
jgi:hypothetical protein